MNKEYPIEEELEEAYKKINELQEENERLKIQVSAREELYEYSQAKIDKAIEITENLLKTEKSGYYQIIFKKQLDILQGEDKQ